MAAYVLDQLQLLGRVATLLGVLVCAELHVVHEAPKVGVHLVGGIAGTLLIGILATDKAPAGVNGLLYGGGVDQLWRQAVGACAVMIVSFVLTLLIGLILQKTIGFRISEDEEMEGVDNTEHAETAYDLGTLGALGRGIGFGSGRKEATPASNHEKEVSA